MLDIEDHTNCGDDCKRVRTLLLETVATLEAEFGDGSYDPANPDGLASAASGILMNETCYPFDPARACEQAERIVARHQSQVARDAR